ncbi:MAG: hypothetical protein OXP75_14240 [Rhodospirillales bacterium]|nr:hypothetical protein [Rhodospirillales bacterium]
MANRDSFLDSYPNLKEFAPFLDDLNKESERGAVLISVSYLEQQLKEIISAFLCEGDASECLLEGFNAPLGTLASRAAAASAMGLISAREYKELETIRKIRNQFAHNHRTRFADQGIADRCRILSFSAKDYDDVVVDARSQFTTAAVSLILNLTNRPHYVSKQRLKSETWPY